MIKKLIILIFFALFAFNADAARIHGTVYNLYLSVLDGAVVQINTEPAQTFVAKNGEYSFNLPKGNYKIMAKYSNEDDFYTEENISVKDEGDYVIDLILVPDLSEEELLEDDADLDSGANKAVSPFLYLMLILISLFSIIYIIRWIKPQGSFRQADIIERDITIDIVDFIKKEGGRVTQKDIREKFPLSEAKISLMISELEHRGVIEKIKKGRGNIIILKK